MLLEELAQGLDIAAVCFNECRTDAGNAFNAVKHFNVAITKIVNDYDSIAGGLEFYDGV